jgi:hypothetical protein
MAGRRRSSAWLYFIGGIGGILIIGALLQNSSALGISGMAAFVLLLVMAVIIRISENQIDYKLKEEKHAIRGARGEEDIGDILAELSEDYDVIHDVESPYGNIDHIVLSRFGDVFLIETKAHGGRVEVESGELLVNGRIPEKNFITQVLNNSYWLRDEINKITGKKPWINAILVFTNAFVVRTGPTKNVTIVNKKYLITTINRMTNPKPGISSIWEQREKIEEVLG